MADWRATQCDCSTGNPAPHDFWAWENRVGFGGEYLRMLDIAYDRYSLLINGKRELIRSGAMHYFRLPSQMLWADRLFKLKAAGYNAVDLYFCWNYHSPEPGVYDFTGIRDVQRLLEITQELGLYVIARPGPYINAEYSGGGFPGWLLAKRDLPLRNRKEGAFEWSDEYMGYVREWWSQIIPFIKAAPNVILMQIENEYATLEVEPDYMRALYEMSREMGIQVPLFHNDLYVAGLYEDIVDIYSFDNYSVTQFETDWREMPEVFQVLDHVESNLRPFCQNRPLMAAELQAGWFGTWKGYKYEKITELLGREHIGISTKSLLAQGLTMFNHYKAIGGTNWDHTGSIETYTSYDFGAPISEAGLNTERLFESKALNYFLMSFDFSVTDREESFPLSLSRRECFYGARSSGNHPEAQWLFLRNLTYEPHMVTVDNRYAVTVKPFEVQILPYQVPLLCGARLNFCTSEPLYQSTKLLVLKADRPVTATLSQGTHRDALQAVFPEAGAIEILKNGADSLTFHCPELPEREYQSVQVGGLTIVLLGRYLIDTFWVEEDDALVFGPEMRLPSGEYALSETQREWYRIPADSGSIQSQQQISLPSVEIPLFKSWEVVNEAPELVRFEALKPLFRPVSAMGADFDANGIYEGSAWYWLPLGAACPTSLTVDARHIWAVFLNGQLIGQGQQLVVIYGMEHANPVEISIPSDLWKQDGLNELLIFVNGLGHPKGFHDDAQTPQGLLGVWVDAVEQTGSAYVLVETYSRRARETQAISDLDTFKQSPLVLMRTTFSLPDAQLAEIPWGLKLQDVDFERINIYLNDCLIGRYWRECRRQEIFYLPTGILKNGEQEQNVLELVLMNFSPYIERKRLLGQPQQVALHPYAIFGKAVFT